MTARSGLVEIILVDLWEGQNAREEALNAILTKAWDEYTTALGQGKVPEVESKYSNLAHAVVGDIVKLPELVDSDAEVA